jgi:hypothetical protein
VAEVAHDLSFGDELLNYLGVHLLSQQGTGQQEKRQWEGEGKRK